MSLATQIPDDLKTAMKAKDAVRRDTLRIVLAGIKNLRAQAGRDDADVSDAEVLDIITREAKKRRESIETYTSNNRPELAAAEAAELAVLEDYLPTQMDAEEISAIVAEVIADTGASGPGDLGAVMGKLMPRVKGRADGKLVNRIVREQLAE